MSGRRAARAEQERKDLRDRLTSFEALAHAAGVHLRSAEPDVVPEVPPSVIAAASAWRPGGLPVVVDVGATRVVAVTGPAGDPREWMPSIAAAASLSLPARQVTRIERVHMPAGLLAAAAIPAAGGLAAGVAENLQAGEPPRRHRPAHRRQSRRRSLPGGLYRETPTGGGLAVRVADTLTAAEARRAAVAAVSAARRNGWQASQTAAIIPVIAAAAVWHAAAISGRVAIFCGVTAATATAAGAAFAVLPGHPVVPLVRVSPLPAIAAHAHAHAHSYIPARKDARHLTSDSEPATTTPDVSPSQMPVRQPQGSAKPERSTSARVPPSRSPSPRPTTSAPTPSPTPSPSPSASGTADVCLGVLILNICVPL
ncbi:MAG TPA: hypothetical protein VGH53_20360 [Streptosporangiaceae bacterium]